MKRFVLYNKQTNYVDNVFADSLDDAINCFANSGYCGCFSLLDAESGKMYHRVIC